MRNLATMFQSAMRIFCCSNGALLRARSPRAPCFNPPCGFFVVRTGRAASSSARPCRFQSAMRIFCCSNHSAIPAMRCARMFQSAMRIFCCSNFTTRRVCWCRSSFNPPCGFFVVRTVRCRARRRPAVDVSIRHADFLLFEQVLTRPEVREAFVSIRHADFLLFEQ